MYQFGIGTDVNLGFARRYYKRCLAVDHTNAWAPATAMLWLLSLQDFFSALPPRKELWAVMVADMRVRFAVLICAVLCLLVGVRAHFRVADAAATQE
eukprot:NODE_16019_length_1017_cov_1.725843.p6 GENE.NODE_16019_length_1017_cov_1.725843~~NODE_16019_length_1017_cov_1.725843.p6  ORF type:complete len:97 (+),score=23.81 NODE_16019_length_1017_cov_1.725843:3-293(+)